MHVIQKKERFCKIISADTSKPEDNRFVPVVLNPEAALDEPMMFQVAPDESSATFASGSLTIGIRK